MTIYIDITQLDRGRANTGIQRVVKEFLQRVIRDRAIECIIISYNIKTKYFEQISYEEIKSFLLNIENYRFKDKQKIELYSMIAKSDTIFFDMDSVWGSPVNRLELYGILKKNGFLIFNFIYDLVPVLFPKFSHQQTVLDFNPYLLSVYKYSDLVFFDSISAQTDFLNQKDKLDIKRDISTRVVGLGSDFLQTDIDIYDEDIKDILKKRYILFVGTIEPRKNQQEVLDSFDILSAKYQDLNLVFIGKEGWKVDKTIDRISTHSLKDKRLYWLNNIDDDMLKSFYKNAFIVVYLSKYEGYGLPIAESLKYGNITIASKNSSMYEVGGDFADYVLYDSVNELVGIVSVYYENQQLFNFKKEHIKQNFTTPSWDMMYDSVVAVIKNFEKSYYIMKKHQQKLQFVFISINFENLKETIKYIDKYMNFVKEYIVITQKCLMGKYAKLESKNFIRIVEEDTILEDCIENFSSRDHQSKNWLLRAFLLNLDDLDDEFIMLDDDNRPLKKVDIEFFISKSGKYNAYYFYNLLEWHHFETDYDVGQQNTKNVLSEKGYELFSYSSHAPQIINKNIYKEAVEVFFQKGMSMPIDEWSIYFNYAISLYPYLFNKKIFETLNWPASPFDWDYIYYPKNITFENYYKDLYINSIFSEKDTLKDKKSIRDKKQKSFLNSKKIFNYNISILSDKNAVHGILNFKNKNIELYISSLPYFVIVEQNSCVRLKLNYKLIKNGKEDISLEMVLFLGSNPRFTKKLTLSKSIFQESIIELPLSAERLEEGVYDISLDIRVNGEYIYKKMSPYYIKMIVIDTEESLLYISSANQVLKSNEEEKFMINFQLIKDKIKSTPILGWFSRFVYNILRINNLKHRAFINEINIDTLIKRVDKQQTQIDKQQIQIDKQQAQIKNYKVDIQKLTLQNRQFYEVCQNIEKKVKLQISQQVSSQAILFHQRIEKFLEEMSFSIDNQEKKTKKLSQIKKDSLNFLLDDYYLAFENIFRGEREYILKRYEKYLKYISLDIKTALDIGCGRGEWVQLLQTNSIEAQGIDLNFAMLNEGASNGVKNLQKIDVFEFLKQTPDNTFDLISAFHIIEHLPYEKLFILFQEILRVSRPNAIVLFETPNPQNEVVASYEFYKDLTHINPLPAPVIKFLVEYIGFKDVNINYINPDTIPSEAQDYLIVAKSEKKIHISSVLTNTRLKLAYISPMPPLKSGIADYSIELLDELSKYYEIEVIIDEENLKNLSTKEDFTIRTVSWFRNHYQYYDRILYHIGNSKFHTYMIDLLEKIPGIITLHDFYLSNLMAQASKLTLEFLYKNHGFKALYDYSKYKDLSTLAWLYPCNKDILDNSLGVIVHSDYSKNLLKKWYMPSYSDICSVVPFIKIPPKNKKLLNKSELNLPDNSFVVCSFGVMGSHKKNMELLEAWSSSLLSKRDDCFLIFVGREDATEYGRDIFVAINNLKFPKNIYITGWTDKQTFRSYLSVCDLAVQLRTFSRGETSGAVFDCMNFNIPLIVNANGSLSELSDDTVYMLKDAFDISELKDAIEVLYRYVEKRKDLALNAKKYLRDVHNPKKCASLYFDTIEKFYQDEGTQKISDISSIAEKARNLTELVESVAYSTFPKVKQRQILVDISTIVRSDLKTGIQRVIRSQLIEMIKNTPSNVRIEPVYLSIEDREYYYARTYVIKLLGLKDIGLIDEPINANRGDIFYGLDLSVKEVQKSVEFGIFQKFKNIGIEISFLVYDLLPVLKSYFFPLDTKEKHEIWLKNITDTADSLICISESVKCELQQWTKRNNKERLVKIKFNSIHLGADIDCVKTDSKNLIPILPKNSLIFLTVGTIEPRKGYKQLLDGFSILLEDGMDVTLVIVGKIGWMMEDFIEKLRNHPRMNREIFWLEGIDDTNLKKLYSLSDCYISTSEGEGFGLPLIEAAKNRLPIIARDIPVFREVAKEYAYYFKDDKNSETISSCIKTWIQLYKENSYPKSDKMPYLTWRENAQQLLHCLLD